MPKLLPCSRLALRRRPFLQYLVQKRQRYHVFPCQNDAGLRMLNVVLCENLVIVLLFTLESKALY